MAFCNEVVYNRLSLIFEVGFYNWGKMYEPPTVDKVRMDMSQFGAFDYIVFAGIFIGSGVIGVFYSLRGKKCVDSAKEYLVGGRNMSSLPVAISLVASCVSGVTLLRVPTEIYLHGTEYAFVFIPILLAVPVAAYLFLPVFYEMQLLSIYEYLERRFDKNVRLFGSLMFMITEVFWLPIALYIPAQAVNQITGVNIEFLTPCVCLICVLYICLGGFKAVVWTDVFQTWVVVVSMILVSIKGSLDLGGFGEVWQRNYEGGRLVFPSSELELTVRHSFLSITVGGFLMWIQRCVLDQKVFQMYSSLPSLSRARISSWLFGIGTVGLMLICFFTGLVIYAFYHDCDPLTTKLAKTEDQLLPLLVMRILSNFPGLPGLFVAGVFSASLSSLSTRLNSMSAVILEDLVKPFLIKGPSKRATNLIMKGAVLFFGVLILILFLIADKLEDVLQLSLTLGPITSGPVFGIFCTGVFLPWVNAKGALLGGIFGLFTSGFVIIGAQNAAGVNKVRVIPKPTSVEGCLYYYNATVLTFSLENTESSAVFPLFKLSYFWYTAFGGFISIMLAVIISAITGFTELKDIDPMWFSPIIRCFLPVSDNLKRREKLLLKELKKYRI